MDNEKQVIVNGQVEDTEQAPVEYISLQDFQAKNKEQRNMKACMGNYLSNEQTIAAALL